MKITKTARPTQNPITMESGEKEKTRRSVFHLHLQEASSHAARLQIPEDFAAYSWVVTKER